MMIIVCVLYITIQLISIAWSGIKSKQITYPIKGWSINEDEKWSPSPTYYQNPMGFYDPSYGVQKINGWPNSQVFTLPFYAN